AVCVRTGVAAGRRVREPAAWTAAAFAAIFACTFATPSWDLSESRANSLPEPDERALARVRGPLRVEAHLAPEDPRRVDLERKALSKLRRGVPPLQGGDGASTSIGPVSRTPPPHGAKFYALG